MIRSLFRNVEEIAGGTLLVLMCVTGVVKVASRYLFASPLAWPEELATLLFAWLVFIGASLALKQHEHFAIELFVELLPRCIQKWIELVQRICLAVFCLLLIGYGTNLVVQSWPVKTPLLGISRSWIYLSVVVGGVLMLIRTLQMPAFSKASAAMAEEDAE